MLRFELDFVFFYSIGFVLSVSIHEFSHAYALYLFGDRSERTRNRLSLRPDLHFKWWGYLLLLSFGLIVGNPVILNEDEVDPKYNWYLVLIVTKLAGPLSNLFAATIMIFVMRYIQGCPNVDHIDFEVIMIFLDTFAFINLFLFVFNMIPIPVLDGGVFLLIIGLMLELDWFVAGVSLIGVIALLISFTMFPDLGFVEFIMDIPEKIKDILMMWIVGKGAY